MHSAYGKYNIALPAHWDSARPPSILKCAWPRSLEPSIEMLLGICLALGVTPTLGVSPTFLIMNLTGNGEGRHPQRPPSPQNLERLVDDASAAAPPSVVQAIDRVLRRRDQRSHLVSHCDHLCRAHPVTIGVAITDWRAGVRSAVDAAPLPAAHGRALAFRSPPGLGQAALGRPQPQRWVHELRAEYQDLD
jgi:hypothetical protein